MVDNITYISQLKPKFCYQLIIDIYIHILCYWCNLNRRRMLMIVLYKQSCYIYPDLIFGMFGMPIWLFNVSSNLFIFYIKMRYQKLYVKYGILFFVFVLYFNAFELWKGIQRKSITMCLFVYMKCCRIYWVNKYSIIGYQCTKWIDHKLQQQK